MLGPQRHSIPINAEEDDDILFCIEGRLFYTYFFFDDIKVPQI